jgi:dihydropteroate synthase
MPGPLVRHYRCGTLELGGHHFEWGARTYVMGVINVTPDSFSGDGTGGDVGAAVALAQRMEREGADILDIGAESTRPNAAPIDGREELRRLMPSLAALRAATGLPLSVDTYRAEVAEAAIAAGAELVNDISGLRADAAMAGVVARAGVPLVAMHNQRARAFRDVAGDIRAGFEATLAIAEGAGIDPCRVIVDTGFGFGWRPEQNMEMLRRLPELHDLGLPLLVGVSRKSTLGLITGKPVEERMAATAAAVALAIAGGADIVRVHDVAEMLDAARVADAGVRGRWRSE